MCSSDLPYVSSKDAMSKYLERCTAVGLRLVDYETLKLFVAHGLDDLVHFRICPTPHFLENEERLKLYRQRLSKKNWLHRWPQLEVNFS